MAEKTIYKMVEYEVREDGSAGFFYQLTPEDHEQGPFQTRGGAVADASWRISNGFQFDGGHIGGENCSMCNGQECPEHTRHSGNEHTFEQHHSPEDHVGPGPCSCDVYKE